MTTPAFANLNKDFMFFYEKGGSAPMPAPPDPMAQAQAQIAAQNNQAMIDRQNKEAQDARDAAKRVADINASTGRVTSAYNTATDYGNSQLSSLGLDAGSGYGQSLSNLYRASLDRARGSAPEIVTDASSLFSPNLFSDAQNQVTGTARRDLTKKVDAFAPSGFAYDTFKDTADDDIIASILGTQRTDAQGALDRALARGSINQEGYNRGMTELGNQFQSGNARAQATGQGVLSGYRKGLTDFDAQTRDAIGTYNLGDTFDVGARQGRLNDMIATNKNSMQGDILAAIGGTNYFDTNTLLGKAGVASGVTNNLSAIAPTATVTTGAPNNALTAAYGQTTGSNTLDPTKQNVTF